MPEIDVENVIANSEERSRWNAMDLSEVVFIRQGQPCKVDADFLEDFKFTGLNNTDLVMMYNWPDMHINQCDGCRRGLPMVDGIHKGEGYDMICCTKNRYS